MEWVQMYHPDVKGSNDNPATVTRESYDEVWFPIGWRLWSESNRTATKKSKEK